MNILSIPLRNSLRKWPRTLLLLAVFTLGVTSIVALDQVSSKVGESLEKKLTAFGANILVHPRADHLSVSYGGFNLGSMQFGVRYLNETQVEDAARSIHNSANISTVAPKLVAMATARESHGALIDVALVGVRWDRETTIKSHWDLDGAFPENPTGLVAGAKAADTLGLAAGDTLRISAGGRSYDMAVSGVLRPTGTDDDTVLLADIGFVQTAYGLEGKASFVEIAALCAGCPIEEITSQLAAALPDAQINALQSVVKQRMYSVNFVKQLLLTVSLVILLTACAMVGLSMLSSVNERVREIGVLRSLGFSRTAVFLIFCSEAAFIGLIAGGAGYGLGFVSGAETLALLDAADGAVLVFNPARMAATTALVCLLSTLAAFIPSWKASRIEPSRALAAL